MQLRPGGGITRKNAPALDDSTEQDDLDSAASDLVDKLKSSLYVNNEVKGDNVHFNQDVRLMKRLAIQNKLQGNKVNTVQNIKEFNSRPHGYYRKKTEGIDSSMNKLSQALRAVAPNDDNNDEATINEVAEALRRLAIKNKISGNKVNTMQNIKEYNEELVEAIAIAARKLDKFKPGQSSPISDDLSKFADELRRIAIKNDITGKVVNTKQDIKEYNDDVVKTIVKAFRRLAIKNDIKGAVVNTKQDISEHNDDVATAVADAIRRLAIENNFSGKQVNTGQTAKEFNNDDPNSIINDKEAAEILRNIYKPLNRQTVKEKNIYDQQDSLVQEDFVDPRSDETPSNSVTKKIANVKTFGDSMDARRINLLSENLGRSISDLKRTYGDDNSSDDDNSADDDDDDDEEDEKDNVDENQQEVVDDEINDESIRRMTVNNNLSERTLESRRLATSIDNKMPQVEDTKEAVVDPKNVSNKDLKTEEISPLLKTKAALTNVPTKFSKNITCKTKEGRNISEDDLTKFIDLLEKLKAAQRISDAMKSSK